MNNRILNSLKYILGWPFSILAFIFIIKIITPQAHTIYANIKNPNYVLLSISIICFILYYFIRSVLWHTLLKIYNGNIRLKTSSYYWAHAELRRYIPGNIWGFLARTIRFSEIGIKKRELAKLLIIEAGLVVMGSIIVSALSLSFILDYILTQFPNYYKYVIWIILGSGIILYIYNYKINKLWHRFTPADNILTLLLATISSLFFGFGYYFAISAVAKLPVDLFFQLSGFFVLSFLIGALSIITPAGFGVREGAIIVGISKLISTSTAGFIALFARFVLVISELLFVLILFILFRTKNKFVLKVEKWIGYNKQLTGLLFLLIIFIIYFTTVSFLRHDNFYTGKFDLGNMSQTVWNTTQGRIFQLTDPDGIEIVSRLAVHADFFLILLTPFYALFPTPKTLLFIQVIIVGAGVFFVYKLALRLIKNQNIALAFSFSYLLNPSLQRSILYDFHSVVLATSFLLGAYYFYLKKQYKTFIFIAIFAAITKEQIWLILGIFGVFIFFKEKKRIFGSALFISSFLIFYYLVSSAIPAAKGDSHFALSYYSQFGDSPYEIIKNIILSPQDIVKIIFEKERIEYLIQLFMPVGFLPIFAPIYLIFALPDLLKNILSSNPNLHQIYYQYTAAITPFIYISSIYAISFLKKVRLLNKNIIIITFICFFAIYGAYKYGPLPGSKNSNIDVFTKQINNKSIITDYTKNIPEHLSVAATNNIGAHLTHRERLYVLPQGINKADVVVFLIDDSDKTNHTQNQKKEINKLRDNRKYKIGFEKDGFVVFIRN